jgi:pimeloyl-ACP methyl ester carboxylesterase
MSILLFGAGLALLILAGLGVCVRRRPLATLGWLSRVALWRAGLRRRIVDTPVGRQSVWIGGRGPVVVLLHGAGDQAGTWARTVPALITDHRVIAPDLPGHGGSEPRSGPLPVGTVTAGTAAVLAACAPGVVPVVVGNSLGAWVALLYAAGHPTGVGRLVLVNGGALRGDRSDITFTPSTREEARLTLQALLGVKAGRTPDFVVDDLIRVCRLGPLGRLAQTAGDMEPYLLEGRLHEVTTPVDLLWGDRDQVFPLSYAERMATGLPAARLTCLTGCGHTPHREKPSRFNEALRRILAEPAPEANGAPR